MEESFHARVKITNELEGGAFAGRDDGDGEGQDDGLYLFDMGHDEAATQIPPPDGVVGQSTRCNEPAAEEIIICVYRGKMSSDSHIRYLCAYALLEWRLIGKSTA